jgi:hypothetical protein
MRKPAENAILKGGLIWIAVTAVFYLAVKGAQWLMRY